MVNKLKYSLLFVLAIFVVFYNEKNVQGDIPKKELSRLVSLVNKVHNSIHYGMGDKNALFTDEVLKVGEGHCGHYSRMLFRELLKIGYAPEIVSITTYDRRGHSMIEVKTKNKKTILLDATTNILYLNSAAEIINNPSIIKHCIIGKSTFEQFSNISLWSNIRRLQYLPYLDAKLIKDFAKNNPKELIDFSYSTIYEGMKFEINFKNFHRISSIVLHPMKNKTIANLKLTCFDDNKKNIYNEKIKYVRSLIPLNFTGKIVCNSILFEFKEKIKIRDIYIYGK